MNNDEGKVSRRRFLEAAVATTAVAGTASAATPPKEDERKRLEELVERYGSEFGDLRKVQ